MVLLYSNVVLFYLNRKNNIVMNNVIVSDYNVLSSKKKKKIKMYKLYIKLIIYMFTYDSKLFFMKNIEK